MTKIKSFVDFLISFVFYHYLKYRELEEIFRWAATQGLVVRVIAVGANPNDNEEFWGKCLGCDHRGRGIIDGYFWHRNTVMVNCFRIHLKEVAKIIIYAPTDLASTRPVTLCELYCGIVIMRTEDVGAEECS